MEIRHCDDNRAERQKLFVETEDGKFKYQIFMDFAKNLPKEYEYATIQGNVSGGCCDKDGNIYFGLRGGGHMSCFPLTTLIKLDPDGNYLGTFCKGKLGHLHFFHITDHGTMVILQTNSDYAIEVDMETEEIVRTFGEKDKPSDTGHDVARAYDYTRMHYGMFATEPTSPFGVEYALYLDFLPSKMAGPFNKPTDVAFDSKGNYYFSDGYKNVAIHKFDANGNYVKSWGGKGVYDPFTDTPGKFLLPHSLCVDKNDNVWVCDREKDALHIFDCEGNLLAYYSNNMGQPSGVCSDANNVYVVGRGGYLTIFDFDFNVVGELGVFNGNLRGHHITCDGNGNLYIFPTGANKEHQVIALKRI